MKNRLKTIQNIKENTFSSKEAIQLGLSYHDLNVLVDEGKISKIGRGIFQKHGKGSFETESFAVILTHLGVPSAICLWSALSFHELTEQVPEQVWVYVPMKKFSHLSTVRVVRKRNPYWEVGIETVNGIRVTDINRTLVDALSDKTHISEAESFKMVSQALRDKKTTVKKLADMASKLGVSKRVRLKLSLLQDNYV